MDARDVEDFTDRLDAELGLARGDGYIRPFDALLLGRNRPTAEYPPLFPGLLATLRAPEPRQAAQVATASWAAAEAMRLAAQKLSLKTKMVSREQQG